MENFKIDVDSDGIALITFDVPGRSMNTITASVIKDIYEIVGRIKSDDAIKGVVFTSGKASGFCAGADLGEMNERGVGGGGEPKSEDEKLKANFERGFGLNRVYRDLETCGKPVAFALEGLALGGGLEFALAGHYRVAADNPKIKLGLPEAKVGLLPGAGGTQRLPRLIGVQNAAMMILQGADKSPQEAKGLGFINEVAPAGQTVEACKTWLKGKPNHVAPWDVKGYKVKDGPFTPGGAMASVGGNAMVSKQTNLNYPAQRNILSCIYEGVQVPIDAALRIESRYFLKTAATPQAKGMVRSLFVNMQALGKGGNRPEGYPTYEIKKVAVLGAGLMGAGIAYVQAKAGIETVLLDVSQESAEKGKAYSQRIVDKDVSRGKITKEKGDEILARITPSTDYSLIKGSDLVVEAVFESPALKAEVTKKAEAFLGDTAVFGTNTSTLPITGLAEASVRPKNFIGIHFFSPVERMGLVELIMGKETSAETQAKAIDYVIKIRKTPITVNDFRGFYTSRCFGTYPAEGVEMLMEGIAPAIIENVGRQCGMPMGPLEVSDSVGLDTALKIGKTNAELTQQDYKKDPRANLLSWIVEDKGRVGRKGGKGYYEYGDDGKPTRIWPGISERIEVKVKECPPALKQELTKRFLFRQCIEVARCFEEGVITDPRDADVGSILAWGFAPYSGGCISYIDLFWGTKKFVEEADRLADAYGDRFRPNKLLRDMAAKNESFYERFGAKAKQAA
ncbi:MAG TPA: 3-hydroxyacyl-CoA dehydrogenase NAD-binding domain-containing protein [Vitreimonas sp.]|uniref:3-hydroxyacyl-CoA dehydrogenase NAD-binding domain-containing protein n=1 Tax=Vitreimonas sp. TaxID=3069702 RepID=UPI002D46A2AD|nr:3-hydroxyacyl-CoA dehydrogenase NAD-binding domain-containing protein [Vitreimonas sp.]HYD86536.1 3-hydroxyacyl-CoA dehydrogenase NAD-binding domain-containing protein [Vitreimonas sp.]